MTIAGAGCVLVRVRFRQACRWMACSRGLILTAPNDVLPAFDPKQERRAKPYSYHTEAKR